MMVNNSKLLSFASCCLARIRRVMPEYSIKYSRKDYTQHQLATLLCLMRKYKPKYRDFVELLNEMTTLIEFLGLKKVPHFTTLNKFFLRMKTQILTLFLELSIGGTSGHASIDSSGWDRRHASKHYVKRTKMRLKAIKSTMIVDIETQKILDLHTTTTRKHDSKIILPAIKRVRKSRRIKSLRGDRGYDDKKVRRGLRSLSIRPLIKHREFKPLQKAWNKRMNMKDYNQRWKNETVISVIKRKYGDYVASKGWFTQFKEIKLMAIVYNIDVEIRKFFIWIARFLQSKRFVCLACGDKVDADYNAACTIRDSWSAQGGYGPLPESHLDIPFG